MASYDAAKAPVIKVKGKGNYTGQITRKFSIVNADISELTMSVNDLLASTSPKKYAQKPVITDINGVKLKAGTDYNKKLEYTYAEDVDALGRNEGDKVDEKDIIPAGSRITVTAYGIGYYDGKISATYTIASRKISDLQFTVNEGRAYTYTEMTTEKVKIYL